MFVDFSVARGELPPPRHGCPQLLASPRGIKLLLRTCRSNSVSFHFTTQTFPEKVLVFSNHALLKSFAQSTQETEPSRRPTACTSRIVHRSMDPEVPTAKGQVPHDEACRSLRTATVFVRLPTAVITSGSEPRVALFRPSWKRKPFLMFVFRIWSRRMFFCSQ